MDTWTPRGAESTGQPGRPRWAVRHWVAAALLTVLIPMGVAAIAAHVWLVLSALPYLRDPVPWTPRAVVLDVDTTEYNTLRYPRTDKQKHKSRSKHRIQHRTLEP